MEAPVGPTAVAGVEVAYEVEVQPTQPDSVALTTEPEGVLELEAAEELLDHSSQTVEEELQKNHISFHVYLRRLGRSISIPGGAYNRGGSPHWQGDGAGAISDGKSCSRCNGVCVGTVCNSGRRRNIGSESGND